MREKSSHADGEGQRKQARVKHQLPARFYAAIAEAAAIDLQASERGVRQRNHEDDE